MDNVKVDVCIVGAGFAGLAAAYKLKQAGRSVYVLEARKRVGGRVYTEVLPDGTVVNWGGTFIGAGHDRLYALAKELGCETYPSYTKGDKLMLLDGKTHRYSGAIPRVNPFALIDVGLAIEALNSMARLVPLEAPWDAKKAHEWDSQTLGEWIDSPLNALTTTAKKILRSLWTEVFMSDPNEVSLLHTLFMIHSLKSIEWIASDEGGAQQDLLVGGMQRLAERMLAKIDNPIRFQAPVRNVAQDSEGVNVTADGFTVKAARVIIAIPPILAGRIQYDPPLPPLRNQLMDRSPAGQVFRCYAIYQEPFWRSDGFTGVGADMDGIPQVSIEASPKEGKPGVLTAYIMGPPARHMATVSADERRKVFLDGLVKRFGPKAANPVQFAEFDWAAEEWTRGDMFAHYAPGVLTGFGRALREPCGRIHWAGTETATQWSGSIEGAIRSGERAADEVLKSQHEYNLRV